MFPGKNIPGAFVGWDNTPRKGINGTASVGDTPEVIKDVFKKQIITTLLFKYVCYVVYTRNKLDGLL